MNAVTPLSRLMIISILIIGCSPQYIFVEPRVSKLPDVGPVVEVVCLASFPMGTTNPTYKWLFAGEILSENDKLIATNSSRYSLSWGGYLLSITNAVKEDEGAYECLLEYTLYGGNETETESQLRVVEIVSYLPSLNYPECNHVIDTPDNVSSVSEVSFNCTVGESAAEIDLELYLKRSDGSIVFLGKNSIVNFAATEVDNGALLICNMTSTTFPTADRSCFAGPLALYPDTVSSPTMPSTGLVEDTGISTGLPSTPIQMSTEQFSSMHTGKTASRSAYNIPLIVAIIIAVLSIAFNISLILKLIQMQRQARISLALQSFQKDEIYQELDTSAYMELKHKTESTNTETYTDLKKQDSGRKTYMELELKDNQLEMQTYTELKEQYEQIHQPVHGHEKTGKEYEDVMK